MPLARTRRYSLSSDNLSTFEDLLLLIDEVDLEPDDGRDDDGLDEGFRVPEAGLATDDGLTADEGLTAEEGLTADEDFALIGLARPRPASAGAFFWKSSSKVGFLDLSPMKLVRLNKSILQLFSSCSSPGPVSRVSFFSIKVVDALDHTRSSFNFQPSFF